jgi:ribonucleotide reductase alpha subunit
MTKVKQTC